MNKAGWHLIDLAAKPYSGEL